MRITDFDIENPNPEAALAAIEAARAVSFRRLAPAFLACLLLGMLLGADIWAIFSGMGVIAAVPALALSPLCALSVGILARRIETCRTCCGMRRFVLCWVLRDGGGR